jgi:hypothetical protein
MMLASWVSSLTIFAAGVAANQDEQNAMTFFEVRAAEPRTNGNSDDIFKMHEQNPKCFETTFGNSEVLFAARWCGLPLIVNGLNVSEVIQLSQEEYCVRIVEIGILPLYHDARSIAACEYTREMINEIRIAAGMFPVHIP